MKITLKLPSEYNITNMVASFPVRHLHDIEMHKVGEQQWENPSELSSVPTYVCDDGEETLQLIIDIDTGDIINWKQGVELEINSKVVDEGYYTYFDENGDIVYQYNGYVPDELAIDDEGYGDYICMTIDEFGHIVGWNKKVVENTLINLTTEE